MTSIILVTVVFGLFILSAVLRIMRGWKKLHANDPSRSNQMLAKLDLVFSAIFLVGSIMFYAVFIMNMGR